MAAYMSTMTYTQAKSRVARAIGGQGDAAVLGAAGDGVNQAINMLNTMNWNWSLELSPVINLVAGTADYALPTNFKALYNARLSTNPRNLVYEDLRMYDWARWNQAANAPPIAYTVLSYGTPRLTYIRMLPTPSVVDTLYVKYFRKIQKPALDADTMDIPEIYDNLLLWFGKFYFLADRDAENARTGLWQQRAENELKRMFADDDKQPDRDDRLIPAAEHMRPLYDPTHPYFYLEQLES